MGEAAAPLAAASSVASLGLTAMGTIAKGQGTKAADEFQADKAERAAEYGRAQAELTDATMREQLNTTLGNIDVIRSAGNVDPTSPTTGALEDRQQQLSDRQRIAKLVSIRGQADEDVASADYLRRSGEFALQQSYIGAAAGVAGGVAKGFSKGGSFNLGG